MWTGLLQKNRWQRTMAHPGWVGQGPGSAGGL
jgi:hypothetical protein